MAEEANKTILPTPEYTPEPQANSKNKKRANERSEDHQAQPKESEQNVEENDETQQQRGRRSAEIQIKRIMECQASDAEKILNVSKNSDEKERIQAWRTLACSVHPIVIGADETVAPYNEPYKKLQKAAEDLHVDSRWISEVDQWDGRRQLQDLDHLNESDRDSDQDEGAEDLPQEESQFPQPTERVQRLYDESTQWIVKLKKDPSDVQATEELKRTNAKIEEEAAVKNTEDMTDEGTPIDYWNIESSFFTTHYRMLNDRYQQLLQGRQIGTASEEILEYKRLIDLKIERKQYPTSWAMETAQEFLRRQDPGSNIEYPWFTLKTLSGSTIVGYYPVGRGTRALIEREEEGRLVRSYEAGSQAGVTAELKSKGLNLSQGQSDWSKEHAEGFQKVLWVPETVILRKNIAAARRRSPTAHCCVAFKESLDGKPNIHMLTVSSLRKVLGKDQANLKIRECCRRDGIPTPWEAGAVVEFNDPAAVEPDPDLRREMRREIAQRNSDKGHADGEMSTTKSLGNDGSTLGQVSLADKVQKLENRLQLQEDRFDKSVDSILKEISQHMGKLMVQFQTSLQTTIDEALARMAKGEPGLKLEEDL